MVDTNDVAHKIALALTEASQRGGGSSKISGSPNKKNMPSSDLKSGKKVLLLQHQLSFSVISFK